MSAWLLLLHKMKVSDKEHAGLASLNWCVYMGTVEFVPPRLNRLKEWQQPESRNREGNVIYHQYFMWYGETWASHRCLLYVLAC